MLEVFSIVCTQSHKFLYIVPTDITGSHSWRFGPWGFFLIQMQSGLWTILSMCLLIQAPKTSSLISVNLLVWLTGFRKIFVYWLILKNDTKDVDEEISGVWRTNADRFHDLSQGTHLWGSADAHLLSEPWFLGFWGDLIMLLNDDSHLQRNWARVHSDADRLTLRKPSKPGSPRFP